MTLRRQVIVACTLLVATVSLGLVIRQHREGDAADRPVADRDDVVTAPVERRVLASVVMTRGRVGSSSQQTVVAPPVAEDATRGVVTALPVPVGEPVAGGGVAVEVNGRPVLVWPSRLPLYRELRPGMAGPDVLSVQEALGALGRVVGEQERSVFGPETRAAVAEVYRTAGYEPTFTLGSEAAVADAVVAAEREADAALAAVNAARATGTADPVAEQAYDAQRAAVERIRATEGVTLGPAEFVTAADLPATVLVQHVAVGASVEEGAQLVTIGSDELLVEVGFTAGQAAVLDGDLAVEVVGAGYSSECVPGPIAPAADTGAPAEEVSDDEEQEGAAQDGADLPEGSGPVDGFTMAVDCAEPPPVALLGADVSVEVTVRGTEDPVLVVPATAVATSGSGVSTVDVVDDRGTDVVEVVTLGEADGFVGVQVRGDELREGDRVRVRE